MPGDAVIAVDYSGFPSCVLPLDSATVLPTHSHPQHQLAWCPDGVLTMEVRDTRWIVQRSRALWIPGGIPHAVRPLSSCAMVSVHFEPPECPLTWSNVTVVDATGLVGPLLTYLAELSANDQHRRARATAVLWDLITPTAVTPIPLLVPTDPQAKAVALAIRATPQDDRRLEDWGRHVGASTRTLSRRFQSETGVSFESWRTLERLNAALPLLAAGESVSRVAHTVGYKSTSAFVSAFRREIGTTPASYFSDAAIVDAGVADIAGSRTNFGS